LIRTVMKLRLSGNAQGSVWTTESAPSGMLRRVFAKLRLYRHGPDGPAVIAPFA
jgi:hypothetical protein